MIQPVRRPLTLTIAFTLSAVLVASVYIGAPLATRSADAAQTQTLPARLTDAEFWKLANDISEPGGFFQSDNFTSNEREVGPISGMLRASGRTGGVYLGVGPEQNFSYIAVIKPQMAFIVDIRRQAAIQHLMYKAIFEMSPTRADFISMLFSKPRPAGIDSNAVITRIWDLYYGVRSDDALYRQNLARIKVRLTNTHGFALTPEEVGMLDYVYEAFFVSGPSISSRGTGGGGGGGGRGGGGGGTTFANLTSVPDNSGTIRSFLDSEASYRVLKDLHDRNLLVPATGNFGGPKAIRAVGEYVRARRATMTAFYLSNVEQYLFVDNIWREFYGNVATLPVTEASVFIRPYAMRRYAQETSLCPIAGFIRAVQGGTVYSNEDALRCLQK